MSSMAKKTRCHHLWLRVKDEYDACNWSATSMPFMIVVYSNNTGDVGMFSLTAPFLCGTSFHGTHGNPIRKAWVNIRRTGHLSFHITQLKPRLSCIAHSMCPYSHRFQDLVFFKCDGIPMRFDRTVPVAYFPFNAKSLKRGTKQKKLSITTQCPLPSKPCTNLITTPYVAPPSPQGTSNLTSASRFLPQYTSKQYMNLEVESTSTQNLIPYFSSFFGMYCLMSQ
jgi:hypothetical protein